MPKYQHNTSCSVKLQRRENTRNQGQYTKSQNKIHKRNLSHVERLPEVLYHNRKDNLVEGREENMSAQILENSAPGSCHNTVVAAPHRRYTK